MLLICYVINCYVMLTCLLYINFARYRDIVDPVDTLTGVYMRARLSVRKMRPLNSKVLEECHGTALVVGEIYSELIYVGAKFVGKTSSYAYSY